MKFAKAILALILAYSSFCEAAPKIAEPKLSKERIIFHTNFGDIVIALFPEVAPQHAAQILKLVRAGVYHGAEIFRVEPGFVAQIANYDIRPIPLNASELAAIKKIPAEFNRVHHQRGILSMARYDDPDSAEASFSFVLGEASHLDGNYTAFGRVTQGFDVLDSIEHITTDNNAAPIMAVKIENADIIDASLLDTALLIPARSPEVPGQKSKTLFEVFAALMFMTTVIVPIIKTILNRPVPVKSDGHQLRPASP